MSLRALITHKAKRTPRQISLLSSVLRPRSIIRQIRKSGLNIKIIATYNMNHVNCESTEGMHERERERERGEREREREREKEYSKIDWCNLFKRLLVSWKVIWPTSNHFMEKLPSSIVIIPPPPSSPQKREKGMKTNNKKQSPTSSVACTLTKRPSSSTANKLQKSTWLRFKARSSLG